MKVTINDVAKEANVSMSTVSRVINNNYPVKKETRERVEKAIKKLRFNPNVLARSLINRNSKTIGVLVPKTDNPFFSTVIKAIEDIFKKKGYYIYLCDTDDESLNEVSYINSLIGRQVDGIISVDPKTENMKNGFYESVLNEVPIVCINGFEDGVNCNFVMNNEENGASEAINYLIELGHQNIMLVRGDRSYSYDLKEKVYLKTLEKNNLVSKKKILNVGGGNSYETVENTMRLVSDELLNDKSTTAVFACNDLMAVGVLNACKKLKIDVPNQISIIGFDNIPLSRFTEPKITTVDQNMYELGRKSSNMLLDIIEKESKSVQKIKIDTRLIIRESCERVSK